VSGTYQVKLTVTTASAATASVTHPAAATVTAAAPTIAVTASAWIVVVGQPETIAWGSRNASSVVLTINNASHGSVTTSGKGTVYLRTPGTYVYTYKASGAGGSASKSVTITVWSQQTYASFLNFLAWWFSHTPAERAQLLAYFASLAAQSH
jgi:hypothetical protein